MKYTCDKCKKEFDIYGGYAVTEMKNLCPKCWQEYIVISHRHYRELNKWWNNE